MTVKDAYESGYQMVDVKWTQGYMSRKTTDEQILSQPVQYSRHRKMYYYEVPAYNSTRYHYRIYIRNIRGSKGVAG